MSYKILIPKDNEVLEAKISNHPSNIATCIICHQHPLYGGTMDNKVVTSVAKIMQANNISTIQFNFRGVGNSTGNYSNTIGEIEDLTYIYEWSKKDFPKNIILVGVSFGSFIAFEVAKYINPVLLITIVPAITSFEYKGYHKIQSKWIIIASEQDEVIPINETKKWYKKIKNKDLNIIYMDASHFFHGKLIELQNLLSNYLKSNLDMIR